MNETQTPTLDEGGLGLAETPPKLKLTRQQKRGVLSAMRRAKRRAFRKSIRKQKREASCAT